MMFYLFINDMRICIISTSFPPAVHRDGSPRPAGTLGSSHSYTAGLPRPDPDSDGIRVTQAHAAVHGLACPAVTLGIATLIRPGPRARIRTRMASESAQATSLR